MKSQIYFLNNLASVFQLIHSPDYSVLWIMIKLQVYNIKIKLYFYYSRFRRWWNFRGLFLLKVRRKKCSTFGGLCSVRSIVRSRPASNISNFFCRPHQTSQKKRPTNFGGSSSWLYGSPSETGTRRHRLAFYYTVYAMFPASFVNSSFIIFVTTTNNLLINSKLKR
jgi:hypothetical protein